jgi:lysophospholipase L1-like esterase
MIGLQVPQIPSNAQLVIVDWGDADLGVSGSLPATSQNAWTMTKAILSRAPHTRIIYIGLHCAPDCAKAGVNAWNDMDATLGRRYGGYVDVSQIGPDGINAEFPDGGHMSLEAAAAMAERVVEVMRTLH